MLLVNKQDQLALLYEGCRTVVKIQHSASTFIRLRVGLADLKPFRSRAGMDSDGADQSGSSWSYAKDP